MQYSWFGDFYCNFTAHHYLLPMIRCVHCGQVHAISRAGKVRSEQRYFCKDCNTHFTLSKAKDKKSRPKKNTITIHDIAQALNISFSTVSKALHNKADISNDTKKKVFAMAKKLNYQPNLNAQSLVNNRSFTIGIIAPSISNFFFPTIISGIQEVASEHEYNILVCLSHESFDTEVNNCKLLMANRVDGLIMAITSKTNSYDHITQLQKRQIPVVFVNRAPSQIKASKVCVDDYRAACKIVKHLIDQGCRKIAHVAGPQNMELSKKRLQGYVDTMTKHKMDMREEWIVYNDRYMENSKLCVEQLLDLQNRPDAIFAYTDFVGIDAITLAKQRNIPIPEELCVAGFSNDPISAIIEPGLTTMSQPPFEIGKIAAEILISHIRNKKSPAKVTTRLLEIDLIKRASTDKKNRLKLS